MTLEEDDDETQEALFDKSQMKKKAAMMMVARMMTRTITATAATRRRITITMMRMMVKARRFILRLLVPNAGRRRKGNLLGKSKNRIYVSSFCGSNPGYKSLACQKNTSAAMSSDKTNSTGFKIGMQ